MLSETNVVIRADSINSSKINRIQRLITTDEERQNHKSSVQATRGKTERGRCPGERVTTLLPGRDVRRGCVTSVVRQTVWARSFARMVVGGLLETSGREREGRQSSEGDAGAVEGLGQWLTQNKVGHPGFHSSVTVHGGQANWINPPQLSALSKRQNRNRNGDWWQTRFTHVRVSSCSKVADEFARWIYLQRFCFSMKHSWCCLSRKDSSKRRIQSKGNKRSINISLWIKFRLKIGFLT